MEGASDKMFSKGSQLTTETVSANAEQSQESKEKSKPKQIKTARGSVYTYLPDGRTSRFKVATGETFEPMDVLVFVPPWEKIKDQIPAEYTHIFKDIEYEMQYDQLLLEYVHLDGKTIYIIDEKSKYLKTQADVDAAERAFLAFIDKVDKKKTFTLPVAKEPRIGFHTFDTGFITNKEGIEERHKHLGNKVVDIEYSE